MDTVFAVIVLTCLGIGLVATIIGFFLFNGSDWWNKW